MQYVWEILVGFFVSWSRLNYSDPFSIQWHFQTPPESVVNKTLETVPLIGKAKLLLWIVPEGLDP